MLYLVHLAGRRPLIKGHLEERVGEAPEGILSLICAVQLPDIWGAVLREHATEGEEMPLDVLSLFCRIVEFSLSLEHARAGGEVHQRPRDLHGDTDVSLLVRGDPAKLREALAENTHL